MIGDLDEPYRLVAGSTQENGCRRTPRGGRLAALSPLDWPPLPGRDVSQERTTGSDQTGLPAKRATASGKRTSRREKYEAAVW